MLFWGRAKAGEEQEVGKEEQDKLMDQKGEEKGVELEEGRGNVGAGGEGRREK